MFASALSPGPSVAAAAVFTLAEAVADHWTLTGRNGDIVCLDGAEMVATLCGRVRQALDVDDDGGDDD